MKATAETVGFAGSLEKPPKGVLVLSSCAPGQVSVEDKDLGHGVFMNYLLRGLAGEADRREGNRNDRVSLLELYRYSHDRTKTHVVNSRGILQTPELYGRITGDFEFGERASKIVDNSIGMKLVLLPAGEFMRESRESAAEAPVQMRGIVSVEAIARALNIVVAEKVVAEKFEDDHPQRKITITRPFYLSVHEVTVGQFRQFFEADGYKTELERDGQGGWGWNESENDLEGPDPKYNWRNPGFEQTDDHPIVNVTKNDALAFCKWLSRTGGQDSVAIWGVAVLPFAA